MPHSSESIRLVGDAWRRVRTRVEAEHERAFEVSVSSGRLCGWFTAVNHAS